MTLITYEHHRFNASTAPVVDQAIAILDDYQRRGYKLNLRALFYQFIGKNLLPNTTKDYKRLGAIVRNARRAGLISWEAIEDLTRNLVSRQHWGEPRDVLEAARHAFAVDMWINQPFRPEVWIEKAAGISVIENVCVRHDVPFFACRGNNSEPEAWSAGHKRFKAHFDQPNGLDMTRDNRDRLSLFAGRPVEVRRLALNIDQVHAYGLPPNPAKLTDTRAGAYIARFGPQCWELDALDPEIIESLVEAAIIDLIDADAWAAQASKEADGRAMLQQLLEGL